MGSSDRDEIDADYAALRAAVSRILGHSYDALTCPERLVYLERLERETRRLRAPQHALINQLAAQSSDEQLGGTLCSALANRLRITKAEAGRRIEDAEQLGERRALTGEPLAPRLAATAAAQHEGLVGDGHVKVIRQFFAHLPTEVDECTRHAAEADLAARAAEYRPDELTKYAQRVMDWLHPDGEYSDAERDRKRGITLGRQEFDGMSRISGLVTPELRAAIEAFLAKLAAPGSCNPEDETPVVDDAPDEEAVRRDNRSQAQRNHDGLLAGLRGLFAAGTLGQHRGLPVSIVVTTTLKDLEAATGKAVTAGGTMVPIADVIRWAGHAHHYSPASGRCPQAIFDGSKPLALHHTKRLASPAQRIMLYGKHRGCTAPGCDAPAYHGEVHHVTGWTKTHRTDIDDLTMACGPHNRLAEKGWTTRTNARGETEWIPPPHLDHGQPRTNTFHHPEKFLSDEDDDEPD
ncbi:HNH endonuclease signature motif containing protein [Mycobacterium sp. Marseille-P9652]|uniref:HNH endonuclease signature motif containing protein n=1 Tax=Mycobacterium sp. Marseille-P9652 TaxID=2654950 RepID=UPI0012E7E1A8|nr:HNH endonuclease signature motif containing protein [Mycobacterium sp. Marseille-P9652]